MSTQQPIYSTLDDLDDAVNAETEHREDLTMYLEGGMVVIRSTRREGDLYRADVSQCLIEFFASFLDIKCAMRL